MTFFILIGLLLYYRTHFHFSNLLIGLPISLIITLFTTFGLGSFSCCIKCKIPYFRYVISFCSVLIISNSVIYPVSILPAGWIRETYNYWIRCQEPLILSEQLFLTMALILFWQERASLSSLLLSALGVTYFRKTEYYFADSAYETNSWNKESFKKFQIAQWVVALSDISGTINQYAFFSEH